MEFSRNNLEKVTFLLEAVTDEQALYFQDLKNQLDQWGAKLLDCLIKFQQSELNDPTLKNLIKINGSKLSASNAITLEKRLTEIEEQQERISKHLDKFISLLTYPDQVQDQFKALWDAIEQLRSVELLKGIIELPKLNTEGKEKEVLDFYTVVATGESGMSQSTLAKLAGVNHGTISRLRDTLLQKAPSYYLQSYVNQDFTLLRNEQDTAIIDDKQVGNLTLYKADFCSAVITHYAMKGNKIALYYLGNFCSIGITQWVQGITGWKNNK